MRHKIFFYCMLILACFSIHAQNEKLRVAVFDPTSSGTGIDEGTSMAVREIISSTFVNTGKFIIVERSLIERVMQEQKFSNSGAVDDDQASEIGKLIGANKIVLSVITLVGGRNLLSLKLVDVQTANVERQKTQVITTNELLSSIEPLALQLMGEDVNAQRQTQIAAVPIIQPTEVIKSEPSPSTQIQTTQQNVTELSANNTINIPEIQLIYVEGIAASRRSRGINSFYIGKYEITQAQWDAIMGVNPLQYRGPSLPVESISWVEAQAFIKRLNDITKKKYRLPTENEWLYAAKGGKYDRKYKYAGSDNIDDVAWYDKKRVRKVGTYPVGNKRPNALGIYDMTGNVWEWCQDAYRNGHIIRGGSWDENEKGCLLEKSRSSYSNKRSTIGFRVVLSE